MSKSSKIAEPTRREILGLPLIASGVPSGVASGPPSGLASGIPSGLAGNAAGAEAASPEATQNDSRSWQPLQVWVTDATRRISPAPPVAWAAAGNSGAQDTVTVFPERKHQEILGFGAAFTDAACYLFHQLPAPAREKLFHTLFAPSQMHLNVCRICIGSSDCSTSIFNYDPGDGVDPDLDRFSLAHDQEYILPILRQARGVNPEIFLFASPWSPPGWMTSNGSMLGGCMRHTYMPTYADYFLRFLRGYEAAGVPVQAVTVQNEVDTDQDGTMPACAWPQDYEADFVTMHLGPLFQRAEIATKIWIIDHNYDLWGRAIAELETPDVRKYTNAIAWHSYAGEPEWINRVQNAFPDVEMYWTEGNADYTAPDYLSEWANWGKTFTRILRNCCRSITVWNFASNEHGRPYVGGGAAGIGGAMIIHSQTQEISYSGMFWALGHFSKFIARGARRVESQNTASISHCAFENPDGSLIVVLTNSGGQQTCSLRVGNHFAQLQLPGDSIVTLLAEPA